MPTQTSALGACLRTEKQYTKAHHVRKPRPLKAPPLAPLDAIEQPCYSIIMSACNRNPAMDTLIRTLYRILFTLAARLAVGSLDVR